MRISDWRIIHSYYFHFFVAIFVHIDIESRVCARDFNPMTIGFAKPMSCSVPVVEHSDISHSFIVIIIVVVIVDNHSVLNHALQLDYLAICINAHKHTHMFRRCWTRADIKYSPKANVKKENSGIDDTRTSELLAKTKSGKRTLFSNNIRMNKSEAKRTSSVHNVNVCLGDEWTLQIERLAAVLI